MAYSESELIDELQRLYKKFGRPPKREEMDEYGKCSCAPYDRVWDSWTEALIAAGIEPRHYRELTKEQLADDIHLVVDELGHTPSRTEYENHGKFSPTAVVNHFGNWNEALKELNYEPQYQTYSKDALIAELQELAEKLNKVPTAEENAKHGDVGTTTYQSQFGSWRAALESAGLDLEERKDPRELENPSSNELPYGENWSTQRKKALERDNHKCRTCSTTAEDKILHVHHKQPRRSFIEGGEFNYKEANKLSNLITLCPSCHRKWEQIPIQPKLGDTNEQHNR